MNALARKVWIGKYKYSAQMLSNSWTKQHEAVSFPGMENQKFEMAKVAIGRRKFYLMNTEWGSVWGHEDEVGLEPGLVHVGECWEEPVHVLLRRRQAVGHLLGFMH